MPINAMNTFKAKKQNLIAKYFYDNATANAYAHLNKIPLTS